MAQRSKYTYRGRTHTRKSQRPGKRSVKVKSYCRKPRTIGQWFSDKAKEWGF